MNNPRDASTPKTTSGCAWMATWRRWALPITPRASWAIWSLWATCPKWARRSRRARAPGALESVKAAADFYAPLSGEVLERNEKLLDDPGLLNRDCYGEGWILKVRPSNMAELDKLMSADEYDEYEAAQA